MAAPGPGTAKGMADRHHIRHPREEERPLDVEGLPEEEHPGYTSDPAEEVEEEPGEKTNRPDQPDFSEQERRQYDDPPVESAGPYDEPIAEADRPDR
jgi:hypothetical protein